MNPVFSANICFNNLQTYIKPMEYTLLSDLPIPIRNSRAKYPFKRMIVGQSIFLETFEEVNRARASAYSFKKKHPSWDFICRKQEDGGWRLWRIA